MTVYISEIQKRIFALQRKIEACDVQIANFTDELCNNMDNVTGIEKIRWANDHPVIQILDKDLQHQLANAINMYLRTFRCSGKCN